MDRDLLLSQLVQEEATILDSLSTNRAEQRDIRTEIFLEKYGIKIGDAIEFNEGKETIRGVITSLEYNGVKPVYVVVNQFNSDGKVVKREKRCWYSSLGTIKKLQPV